MRFITKTKLRTKIIWAVILGILVLYGLGACDVFLVETLGIEANLYECMQKTFTGEVICSGPLAP